MLPLSYIPSPVLAFSDVDWGTSSLPMSTWQRSPSARKFSLHSDDCFLHCAEGLKLSAVPGLSVRLMSSNVGLRPGSERKVVMTQRAPKVRDRSCTCYSSLYVKPMFDSQKLRPLKRFTKGYLSLGYKGPSF